jgi:hypothetical protein
MYVQEPGQCPPKPIQTHPGRSIQGVSPHLRPITHLRRMLELELGIRQSGGIPQLPHAPPTVGMNL